MNKIIENEKLLENESLYNKSDIYENINIDLKLKMLHLKSMKDEKKKVIEKIKFLELKIKNMILNDIRIPISKKNIIKNFIENFNRDKEIIEIRTKKYSLESRKRKLRIKKDIECLKEKKEKDLDLQKKQEEKQKEEDFLKFKEKQKYLQLKQLKESEKKTLKCKPYIRQTLENNKNLYFFQINNNKYLKNQKQLVINENEKRKEYMKSIDFKELKKFSEKLKEQKEKNEEKQKSKQKELLKEWKKRKSFLPTYKSKSFILLNDISNENVKNEENKKEIKNKLRNLKKTYSQKIKNEFYPSINQKLYNNRMSLIQELEKSPKEKYKYNYTSHKKKTIILKKIEPNIPLKYNWKLKLEEDIFDKMNNSDMDMKYLIKRPKKINLLSLNKNNNINKNIKNNVENIIKNNINKDDKQLYKKILLNKGEKAIKSNNDIYQNINEVEKNEKLINKVNEEKKLLKMGGFTQNLEQDSKLASLLINSIKMKMNILNQIGKE